MIELSWFAMGILLFRLMIGHAFADYEFQTRAMGMGKNRNRSIDMSLVPEGQKVVRVWYHYLTAHALIHAGMVWLATGNPVLGFAEFILHWLIDFAKCENWTNPHEDQILHFLTKIAYVAIIYFAASYTYGG